MKYEPRANEMRNSIHTDKTVSIEIIQPVILTSEFSELFFNMNVFFIIFNICSISTLQI